MKIKTPLTKRIELTNESFIEKSQTTYEIKKKTKSKQAGTNKHQLEGNSIKLKKRKSIGERINEAKSWFWEKKIKIVKVLRSSRKRGGHVTTYNLALEGRMEEIAELRAVPGYG